MYAPSGLVASLLPGGAYALYLHLFTGVYGTPPVKYVIYPVNKVNFTADYRRNTSTVVCIQLLYRLQTFWQSSTVIAIFRSTCGCDKQIIIGFCHICSPQQHTSNVLDVLAYRKQCLSKGFSCSMSYMLHVPQIFNITGPPVCQTFTVGFWTNNLKINSVCAAIRKCCTFSLFAIDCTCQ
jgi:hypothetical protein